jgi:putative endonuclease
MLRLHGASADEAENGIILIMFYFYVLKFKKNGKLYYGFTENLKRRIMDHKSGNSDFSSRNGPFDLIFYEAYINKDDARAAEKYFKTGHGREVLKEKLQNYLGGVG